MDNKMVSVIITTHNRTPGVVLRAVNSALNQTYDNIEYIVIDDSTGDFPQRDEVEEVVLKASGKIKYIKNETNVGACVSRNIGLAVSRGYYVAFLDDDDEWLPAKIEEQVKGFSDDNITLVYCSTRMTNGTSSIILTSRKDHESGYVFDHLLEHNFIGSTSNPLIKKECIEAVGGFDIEMQARQDYDLWLRIAMMYPIKYIDLPLVIYHIHDQVRISNDIDKQIAGERRLQEKYKEEIQNNKKARYMRCCSFIPLYLKKGWKGKAFSLWSQCIKESPVSIRNNIKYLLHIGFGYDSFLFRFYHIMCRSTFQKK